MTDLIDLRDLIALHAAIKTNENDAHADILAMMYSINCEMIDADGIMQAAEDMVDAAGIASDLADAAIMNRERDIEDARADNELNTRKADGI